MFKHGVRPEESISLTTIYHILEFHMIKSILISSKQDMYYGSAFLYSIAVILLGYWYRYYKLFLSMCCNACMKLEVLWYSQQTNCINDSSYFIFPHGFSLEYLIQAKFNITLHTYICVNLCMLAFSCLANFTFRSNVSNYQKHNIYNLTREQLVKQCNNYNTFLYLTNEMSHFFKRM